MSQHIFGEVGTLIFLAFAVGLDAFSVSLVIGLQKIRLKRIAIISGMIGFQHMVLPAIGMILGQFISSQVGAFTTLLSGLLLFFIGAHIFFGAFATEQKHSLHPYGIGLWILGFSVSVDSFPIGLSFGMSNIQSFLVTITFFIVSSSLTLIGLLIGRRIQGMLGTYSEILSGSILCAFGLAVIFSS